MVLAGTREGVTALSLWDAVGHAQVVPTRYSTQSPSKAASCGWH